jgi:transcriptional regulator with XRE-family HTH domain
MADERQDVSEPAEPISLGRLLSFLRWLPGGWTLTRLAGKTGIDRSQLRRYEEGEERPRPATVRKILAAVGVPERLVSFLNGFLQLVFKALARETAVEAQGRDLANLREALAAAVERRLTFARAELALLRDAPADWPMAPTPRDHRRVEALFQSLTSCPAALRQQYVVKHGAYRTWLLAVRLCEASEDAAADDPGEALELAELAVFLAGHVPVPAAFRTRLQGFCTAFVANSLRVANEIRTAVETFARALQLWNAGRDEAGLLSPARMLDLEASLRRDQRFFEEALRRHRDALEVSRQEEVGRHLLNKSATLEQQGDYEASFETLAQAAPRIDGEREPRLRFGLRFNQAANLLRLERAAEAEPIVAEVKELVGRSGKALDVLRTRWLAANLDAGLGRLYEAREGLEQVRRELGKLPYDYALASLDLALVYRQEGHQAEIKVLAREMIVLFEAQGVHREALASLLLFQEAAQKEAVTVAMVRRLQDYLARAKGDPELRFEG